MGHEKRNRPLVFSVDREIPILGSIVLVGNSTCLVSHWIGGPSDWDFPVPAEHQWWLIAQFLNTNDKPYSIPVANLIYFTPKTLFTVSFILETKLTTYGMLARSLSVSAKLQTDRLSDSNNSLYRQI